MIDYIVNLIISLYKYIEFKIQKIKEERIKKIESLVDRVDIKNIENKLIKKIESAESIYRKKGVVFKYNSDSVGSELNIPINLSELDSHTKYLIIYVSTSFKVSDIKKYKEKKELFDNIENKSVSIKIKSNVNNEVQLKTISNIDRIKNAHEYRSYYSDTKKKKGFLGITGTGLKLGYGEWGNGGPTPSKTLDTDKEYTIDQSMRLGINDWDKISEEYKDAVLRYEAICDDCGTLPSYPRRPTDIATRIGGVKSMMHDESFYLIELEDFVNYGLNEVNLIIENPQEAIYSLSVLCKTCSNKFNI